MPVLNPLLRLPRFRQLLETALRYYQEFLDRRRQARSADEYKPVTNSEWSEFEEHFDRRKVELGDCTRFSSSRHAVRYAGMDITVHQSDQRRSPGHLSRQGPPALRWALFEAAQCARRPNSPDHAYYQEAAKRLGGNRACLSVARKLLKRSYHTLRELGEEALQPA